MMINVMALMFSIMLLYGQIHCGTLNMLITVILLDTLDYTVVSKISKLNVREQKMNRRMRLEVKIQKFLNKKYHL